MMDMVDADAAVALTALVVLGAAAVVVAVLVLLASFAPRVRGAARLPPLNAQARERRIRRELYPEPRPRPIARDGLAERARGTPNGGNAYPGQAATMSVWPASTTGIASP